MGVWMLVWMGLWMLPVLLLSSLLFAVSFGVHAVQRCGQDPFVLSWFILEGDWEEPQYHTDVLPGSVSHCHPKRMPGIYCICSGVTVQTLSQTPWVNNKSFGTLTTTLGRSRNCSITCTTTKHHEYHIMGSGVVSICQHVQTFVLYYCKLCSLWLRIGQHIPWFYIHRKGKRGSWWKWRTSPVASCPPLSWRQLRGLNTILCSSCWIHSLPSATFYPKVFSPLSFVIKKH